MTTRTIHALKLPALALSMTAALLLSGCEDYSENNCADAKVTTGHQAEVAYVEGCLEG